MELSGLAAGVDFSSEAIDVALVPIQRVSWIEVGVVFRRREFPKLASTKKVKIDARHRTVTRTRLVQEFMDELLEPCWNEPVVNVFVEEPRGNGKHASDTILNQLLGAILAVIPARIERDIYHPATWRTARGIVTRPAELAKAQAMDKASEWCRQQSVAGPSSHHAAEALLIALTGRYNLGRGQPQ